MGDPLVNVQLSPRHLQLREMLFRRWKTRGVKVGDKIESQNDIVKFCGFSLITVIKTLKDLETQGVIRRQVGKGSFLVKTPWAEAHWRIGFFYNRDIVGGGIFNNQFYTKLVVAFEKSIVSGGQEFILGSFTHKSKPVAMWDALDGVILTGITSETQVEDLERTSSQISVIDTGIDELPVHSYRLDYEPAFVDAFKHHQNASNTWLYLDSQITSPEQAARKTAFLEAHANHGAGQELKVITVNQETDVENTDALAAAIAEFKPDIVCGYIHHDWLAFIPDVSAKPIKVYSFTLDPDQPGFVVNATDWMTEIIPTILANLEDRQAAPVLRTFPAIFVP